MRNQILTTSFGSMKASWHGYEVKKTSQIPIQTYFSPDGLQFTSHFVMLDALSRNSPVSSTNVSMNVYIQIYI